MYLHVVYIHIRMWRAPIIVGENLNWWFRDQSPHHQIIALAKISRSTVYILFQFPNHDPLTCIPSFLHLWISSSVWCNYTLVLMFCFSCSSRPSMDSPLDKYPCLLYTAVKMKCVWGIQLLLSYKAQPTAQHSGRYVYYVYHDSTPKHT